MSGNIFGSIFKLTTFGESHGPSIGGVIDGCPSGIEIDLDAIPNIASSAMTPSGFSVEQLRQFTSFFGRSKNASYLHICEGAPDLGEEKNNHLIGKLIGYLVTDFINANQ